MNLCAKCAQHELTCCQNTEVFVTDGDLQRIATYVGRADFWEYQKPRDPVYSMHQPADPHWLHYTVRPDGTRRLYAVETAPLQEVDIWLERFRQFWSQHLDALTTELARGKRKRREPPGSSSGDRVR